MPVSVSAYANTGGFGIDGNLSALLGASLGDKNKLYFGVIGDLAFFYDMNALGNRHMGNNIRLMVINNNGGTEFRNYSARTGNFGKEVDKYIAAAGHFGNKSNVLLKHYSEDLGCEYLCASTKEEYLKNMERFVSSEMLEKSIVFEVFTDSKDESDAFKILYELETSAVGAAKSTVKNILGENNIRKIKKVIGK